MVGAADPLAGRDLVVTGATGYIGAHFVGALAARGKVPAVLGRPGLTSQALAALPALASRAAALRILAHDGSPQSIASALADLTDPVVIHLAGLFVSAHQPDDVDRLVQSNVGYAASLFEAMQLAGVKAIVNVGTLWEHGETGDYMPVNLYAATKRAAQTLLDYYVQAESFRALSLKLLDTYGRDDPRRKLLPLLRDLAHSGDSLDMSSGHQTINVTHVDDICTALLASARVVATGRADHLTAATLSDEAPSIRELARMIETASGKALNTRWGARPDGPRQQQAPWDAPRPSGWRPTVRLEDGLRRYVLGQEPPLEGVLDV